jgi:hypothetical protein
VQKKPNSYTFLLLQVATETALLGHMWTGCSELVSLVVSNLEPLKVQALQELLQLLVGAARLATGMMESCSSSSCAELDEAKAGGRAGGRRAWRAGGSAWGVASEEVKVTDEDVQAQVGGWMGGWVMDGWGGGWAGGWLGRL